MNIALLKNEIEKLNYKPEIKNKNELYINIEKSNVIEIFTKFINEFKLGFVAEFCHQEKAFIISIVLSARKNGYIAILGYTTENEIISLQNIAYQSHLFEREMADLFGLNIVGGRDTRKIVKHEAWEEVYPMRKDFPHGKIVNIKNQIEDYKFKELSGEGGFQIPVGPVHAGIIEPGHFRFSVIGEQIENLEIRLMYKHRGIEKLCESIDANNLSLIFERVAGESTAAYAEAYALLVEKLLGYNPPNNIKALRVILLELERIYNYLDDIAGICVDVGFSYPAKRFGYFSEMIHQLCERLTGSRFMRNSIIPCGINISFGKAEIADIKSTFEKIKGRLDETINTTLNTVSFLDRVEHTGLVYNEKAKRLCMTGVVGRACGISYDVRHSFPYELYKEIKTKVNTETLGGVFERYKLKIAEINDAFSFIEQAMANMNGDVCRTGSFISLKEGLEAFAAVETVKGELFVYGKVGKNNKFDRIYFKTPSFTNWDGLTYAVLNEIVPDFPLCNKSFNMSYSENDR